MIFNLRTTSSYAPGIETSLRLSGPFAFTIQNKDIINSVDGLARRFSAEVKAKKGNSELISTSALIGGYLHLLCSVIEVNQHVVTFRDGLRVDNEFNGYNVEAQFKYLLICRLQQLLDGSLDAIRLDNQENEPTYQSSNAYAAAVVLRLELNYFKGHIKGGSLDEAVSRAARC